MNEIKRKIRKELKGLTKEEIDDVTNYYEELVSDRLELGESIEDIKKTLDFKAIKYERFTEKMEERENNTLNKSIKNSFTLLLFLFASPILIPLAIVYLTIIFVIYVLIFSLFIVSVSVPISLVFNSIINIFKFISIGDILLNIGSVLLVVSIVLILTTVFINLLYKLNNYLMTFMINLVRRKKA